MTAPAVRAWDRPAVTVPVFAALALVGGQLPSFTTAANLYILGTGGTLIILGRRMAPSRLVLGRRAAPSRLILGRRAAPPRLALGQGADRPRLVSGLRAGRSQRRGVGVGAVWWLLPVGLFAVLELTTLARGGRTLSLLADPLLSGEAGRAVGYFGWLTAFWWLVRR
jgi:hypothetical protein